MKCNFFKSFSLIFMRCGYPFDSGNHNKLWSNTVSFSRVDDRHVSAWLHSHCLLHQAKEELPPASRSPTIEAEREFIQIVIQVFQADGPLMRAQQPAFQQRDDPMDALQTEGADAILLAGHPP